MLKLLIGNPYVLLGIGALILVLGCGDVVLWSRLSAKDAQIEAAKTQRDSATERATANYTAAQQCFAQVEQDKASIALQNDANEKLRASFNDMERAAVNLETEKAQLLQTLDDRTRDTEAEARSAPGDVRRLGPIVLKRVGGLWQ